MAVTNDSLRRALQSGVAFVRGVEVNRSTAALTLDHLLDQQIRSIDRGGSREMVDARGERIGTRMSKLDLLDALEQDIKSAAQAVRDAGNDPDKLAALGLEPDSGGTP